MRLDGGKSGHELSASGPRNIGYWFKTHRWITADYFSEGIANRALSFLVQRTPGDEAHHIAIDRLLDNLNLTDVGHFLHQTDQPPRGEKLSIRELKEIDCASQNISDPGQGSSANA